jgi:hypothetical protein
MLSLQYGERVARIHGGEHSGEYIYLNTEEDENNFNEIKVTDGKLVPLPRLSMVEKIYISGPSGAGKSRIVGMLIGEFKKLLKDMHVYVISDVKHDNSIDKYGVVRVPINLKVLDSCVPTKLNDSLIVFDDTDTVIDKNTASVIEGIRDWILEQGRHYNERIIVTSHLLIDREHTKRILNEATSIYFFPKAGGTKQIKKLLTDYIGLDKDQIKKILKLPSRWVCVYKTYPMFVIYESGAYMLHTDEEESSNEEKD